jgi:hypothetical protein
MAEPAARNSAPIYMREMMERLGIEPGGGTVPSLSLIPNLIDQNP